MVAAVEAPKVMAVIVRRGPAGVELLAFRMRGSGHPFLRLPGGGREEGETPLEALYREAFEESGIARGELTPLRRLGSVGYYKPGVHKRVDREDWLLLYAGDLPDRFSHVVTGGDKDDSYTFDYEWLDASRLGLVDPELAQLLNTYNAPELFMDSRDLGLADGEVELRPHAPEWERLYEFQEMELRGRDEPWFTVDHVGSTAVPDLLAKPILDILIGMRTMDDAPRLVRRLEGLGYEYRGEAGVPGRLYFRKGSRREALFHAHAFLEGSDGHRDHLAVRDALLASEALRRRYEAYKLAARASGRAAYTEGKSPLMAEIIAASR